MTGNTTSIDLNMPIQKKLKAWSQPQVIKQWVNDKIEGNELLREQQTKHLNEFWQALLNCNESNRVYLMQCVLVWLSFPEHSIPFMNDANAIRRTIQLLDNNIRSHIRARLLEEFPPLRDSFALLSQLEKPHESFKGYWSLVFQLVSAMVLLNRASQPILKNPIEEKQVLDFCRLLQRLSDDIHGLNVSQAYDVMDTVTLMDSLIVQNIPEPQLCQSVGVDPDVIELTPLEVRSFVHRVLRRAYALMSNHFENYDVLGVGFKLSDNLIKTFEQYHGELKSGLTKTDKLLNAWRRLAGGSERTAELIAKEREFIHKVIFLNQAGCLNLNLLSQCWNNSSELSLNGSGKVKTFFLAIGDELKQGLMMRAKESQGLLTLRMDAHHPLLKTLGIELSVGKTLIKAPRKATPGNSPAFEKLEVANDGASSPPPHSPYVSREARCLSLFQAKTRKDHVHSRTSAMAQKQELRNYLFVHLSQGTLTLYNLEKQIRQLCCAFWKVGSRESFLHRWILSNTKIQALAIESYAAQELARMAGSEGHEESAKTRDKHLSLKGKTV